MKEYTVVLHNGGTVSVEADEYRTPSPDDEMPSHKELYFYNNDNPNGPISTFPAGQWSAIFEADRGWHNPE